MEIFDVTKYCAVQYTGVVKRNKKKFIIASFHVEIQFLNQYLNFHHSSSAFVASYDPPPPPSLSLSQRSEVQLAQLARTTLRSRG